MPRRNTYFTARPLEREDAGAIAALLGRQSPASLAYFYALPGDEAELAQLLDQRDRDSYMGLFWNDELVGVSLLRGWDAGYEVPAFGVLIDEKHHGGAFMRIALEIAKMTARLSGAPRLMAKIHPTNVSPRGARRLGLVETGREEATGNVIYHYELV